MPTKKLCMFALTVLLGSGLVPATQAGVTFTKATAQVRHVGADDLQLALGDGSVSLQLVAPGVLRVHYAPDGRTTPSSLVIDPDPAAVPTLTARWRVNGDAVTLRSIRLVATWNKHTGRLTLADAQGHLLVQQADFAALAQGRIVLDHAKSDALYGIGGYEANQPVSAGLLRDGMQVARAGKQGHPGAPFVWSTAGYGVLVDCGGAHFDLADGHVTISGYGRPDADYYLMVGTPVELFGELARISGHAPLFPKWSMGFLNSPWGVDEQKLLHIVDTYRAKHIPIDGFILDFDWKAWGEDDYGEFRWNETRFPDGPSGKLKGELDRRGIHLAGIMKPRVHVDTVGGRYATAHQLWLPGEKSSLDYFSNKPVKDIDFDKPLSRNWFGNLAMRYGFDKGIVGWWNDEADNTDSNTQFFNMERALYDAQRGHTDIRVWSLNRNFWLGAQRYAYGLWSGDIDTGFASMAAQRTRMLNAIDVGEMQWSMDGGGFLGHPSDENYARWIEFGAFTPIFRVHGTLNDMRQPWVYGTVAEAAATRAIRLRYALIPYIYAYQHSDHALGVGLVRPLTFGWPHDPKVRNDVDAWLFGQWLLASPVVKQGQTVKHIYLPPGTWIDWFSGKRYTGGRTIDDPVDSKTWGDIPLFIREGAIIPTEPVMAYTGQHPVPTVTVQVFPADHVTHFDYYDDDGETYAYEKGLYYLQSLSVRKLAGTVDFVLGRPSGSFKPAVQYYLLAIHAGLAAAVRVDGKTWSATASLGALKQRPGEGWFSGHDRYGAVTWVKLAASNAASISIESASP